MAILVFIDSVAGHFSGAGGSKVEQVGVMLSFVFTISPASGMIRDLPRTRFF